jgi:hypothetical protein
MHHTSAPRRPLMAMTLAAAMLAAPALALAQGAPATQPGNIPAQIGAAVGNAAHGFTPGTAVHARPRMSQIIGAAVYNEQNDRIGTVDDVVLIAPQGTGPVAVLQVGGFLGLGGRLVSVPLAELRWNTERERVMMPGATQEMLRTRPEFDYDRVGRG